MAPELADGAAVAVAPAARYFPGDVVAFGSDREGLTLHRVIGYRRAGGKLVVLTQADSGRDADSPVTPDAIVGRVLGTVDGGHVAEVPPRRLFALRRFLRYLGRGAARRLAPR